MGSANGPSVVDQLQMDDDMNRIQYSAEYSADINSKMQMPSRLSLEPERESFIEDEEPESNLHSGMTDSPAHGMNVPERILLAGSGSHVGMRETPRDLDLDDLSNYPRGEQAVELTTPPRTLTLDEFHFPTVGTERKDPNAAAMKKLAGIADDSAIRDVANQSFEEPNPYNLQKHMRLLSRRVSDLEDRQRSREYRENIFLVATALYFLYKGFRYFTSSHY